MVNWKRVVQLRGVAVHRGCTAEPECRGDTEFINGQNEFNYCNTCDVDLCNAGNAYVPNQQEGKRMLSTSQAIHWNRRRQQWREPIPQHRRRWLTVWRRCDYARDTCAPLVCVSFDSVSVNIARSFETVKILLCCSFRCQDLLAPTLLSKMCKSNGNWIII